MFALPIVDLHELLHTQAATRSLSGSSCTSALLSHKPKSTRTTVSKGAKANQPMNARQKASVAAQNARMCGLVARRRPQCGSKQGPTNLKGLNSVHFIWSSTGTSHSTSRAAPAPAIVELEWRGRPGLASKCGATAPLGKTE